MKCNLSRKVMALLLSVCMTFSLTSSAFAADKPSSAEPGWTLSADGTLTISSDAGMTDWATEGNKTNLEKVKKAVIESGVTEIDASAFKDCLNLTDAEIPDTVTIIGECAFQETALAEITIPKDVTKIGDNAFKSCESLTEVTMEGTKPPKLGTDVFSDSGLTAGSITVPKDCAKAYRDEWGSDYAELINPDPHVHSGTLVSGEPATCTKEGLKDHYSCSCNRYFEDSECTNQIASLADWKAGAGKISKLAHVLTLVPAKDATCTEPGNKAYYTCSGCDKWFEDAEGQTEITDEASITLPAKGHTFEERWTYNDTEHWHAASCGHTTETKDKAAHTLGEWEVTKPATEQETGIREKSCICGYRLTEEIPMIAHTHILTLVPAKEATCTESGNKAYYTCSGCDKWFEDAEGMTEITDKSSVTLPAKGHTFEERWTYNDTEHWHAASCEHTTETKDKAAHTLGEWEVTKPATEQEAGIREKSCICGYKLTEEIPMIAHTHILTLVPAKDATCTESGSKAYYTCSGCDKWFEDAEGKSEITDKSSVVIPMTAHIFSTDWSHDDSCHWHTCTGAGCDEISSRSYHNWNAGEITTPPTEDSEGIRTHTCLICGRTKDEPIAMSGHTHTPSEDWTTDGSSHWRTCSGCNERLDFGSHEWDDGVIAVEPTEDEEGTKTLTCTACGRTKTESVPKLPHTHRLKLVYYTKPTCANEGVKQHYHCEKCGMNFSDSEGKNELSEISIPIDSSNHAAGTELRDAKRATCKEEGYSGDTYCRGCDKLMSRGRVLFIDPFAHSFQDGRCTDCGAPQFSYIYRPVITYLNDTYHYYNGMSRRHTPNRFGKYTNGIYEWYVCAECGHEYGRTSIRLQWPDFDDGDYIDLIVDDPVECGYDEPLADVG